MKELDARHKDGIHSDEELRTPDGKLKHDTDADQVDPVNLKGGSHSKDQKAFDKAVDDKEKGKD